MITTLPSDLLNLIENALQAAVRSRAFGSSTALSDMISYHMGWEDQSPEKRTKGKRLRPLLCLLSARACGGSITSALPSATAIELLHNFTLIHDDIEDLSELRHGQPTVWKRWGIAQAINAGDALFSIAQLSLLQPSANYDSDTALTLATRFNETCLHLTRGQYLDMAFESQSTIALDAYLEMIEGKTAALVALATELGARTAQADSTTIHHFFEFGRNLGMAFQMQDDALGVWGDPNLTGKSAASDILSRKKTLPIIYGLTHCPEFTEVWHHATPSDADVSRMAETLGRCGAEDYNRKMIAFYTRAAIEAVDNIGDSTTTDVSDLKSFANQLLERRF